MVMTGRQAVAAAGDHGAAAISLKLGR